jgi:hypothetical protein
VSIVAPGGATNCLQEVEVLGALGDDGEDMIKESKSWVESDAQDLRKLAQGNVNTV